MHEADTLIYANEGKNVYMFDKWLDGALLPFYQKELEYSNPRKLIVLHTIGSHWWYNSHFEKEVFSPVLRSKNISSSTQEAIVNSYDNTILYTDCFLHQLIEELRDEVENLWEKTKSIFMQKIMNRFIIRQLLYGIRLSMKIYFLRR